MCVFFVFLTNSDFTTIVARTTTLLLSVKVISFARRRKRIRQVEWFDVVGHIVYERGQVLERSDAIALQAYLLCWGDKIIGWEWSTVRYSMFRV